MGQRDLSGRRGVLTWPFGEMPQNALRSPFLPDRPVEIGAMFSVTCDPRRAPDK